MIEEKIEDKPLGNEENKPQTEASNLIEIEGTVEKAKPQTIQDKKQRLKELKAQKEAEYKAKQKEEKQRLKEQKRAEKANNSAETGSGSSKKKLIIIVLVIFIAIAGAASYVYFMKPELLKNILPGKHQDEKQLLNTDSLSMSETPAATDSLPAQTDTMQTPVPEATTSTTTPAPEPTPEKVSEPVQSSETHKASKGASINGPCWVISYASVSDEKLASKGVKEVVDKGFIGGYYWIPDFDPNGKQMFKIYVGPFTSEADARAKLPEVVSSSPGAYIVKIK